MEDAKMRFYAVGNMYLSSIQQGIQAAHCVGEMNIKYSQPELIVDSIYWRWLANYKTLICLNGGNNKSLNDFYDLVRYQSQFPVAKFHEDEDSLNGMLTCVGIIVPEQIYKADLDDPDLLDRLGYEGYDIAVALKRMPTAR
jgi:hypothetical protein